MMRQLYLIGVDNHDLKEGPQKLERLYAELKPSLILHDTSEQHQGAIDNIVSDAFTTLASKPQTLEFFLRAVVPSYFPFSVQVGNEYAQENGTSIAYTHCCMRSILPINFVRSKYEQLVATEDDASFQWRLNNFYARNTPSPEALQQHWEEINQKEKGWRQTANALGKWMLATHYHVQNMSRTVTWFVENFGGNIVFPLRMEQLMDSYLGGTLYARIKKLKPERIPLL